MWVIGDDNLGPVEQNWKVGAKKVNEVGSMWKSKRKNMRIHWKTGGV